MSLRAAFGGVAVSVEIASPSAMARNDMLPRGSVFTLDWASQAFAFVPH